jgi:hypothetical protein
MKIWADMSAPAHVLVLRPIIERLRGAGHEVVVTSRDYTQTQELLALHHMEHTPIGKHGGASRVSKLMRLIQRATLMRRLARERDSTWRSRTAQTTSRSRRGCWEFPRRTCTTMSSPSSSTMSAAGSRSG